MQLTFKLAIVLPLLAVLASASAKPAEGLHADVKEWVIVATYNYPRATCTGTPDTFIAQPANQCVTCTFTRLILAK